MKALLKKVGASIWWKNSKSISPEVAFQNGGMIQPEVEEQGGCVSSAGKNERALRTATLNNVVVPDPASIISRIDHYHENWTDRLDKIAKEFALIKEAKLVVELACGAGKTSAWCKKYGFSYLGLDRSELMLVYGRRGCVEDNIKLELIPEGALGWPEDADLVIIAMTKSSWSASDTSWYISQARNILKDSGKLLLRFPYELPVLKKIGWDFFEILNNSGFSFSGIKEIVSDKDGSTWLFANKNSRLVN
jgi:SAM-dependent methyltransferase